MDEREFKELFRDAPGEPPPARFTAADVAAESHRATARARRLVVSAAALLVLAGSGIAAGVMAFDFTPGDAGSPVAANAGQPAEEQARPLSDGPGTTEGFPEAEPRQGGEGTGEDGPQGRTSTSGCEGDRELAIALADELPVAATSVPATGSCPEGTATATFQLGGADASTVRASLYEPGATHAAPAWPAGALVEERQTRSGATLHLVCTPDKNQRTTLSDSELSEIADALAARF